MRRGLGPGRVVPVSRSERTGLRVVHLGVVITTQDVRALEDDE
jgi:hypothetical protein